MNHPLLLEINTRCWLRTFAGGAGITLDEVPESEFQRWSTAGFTHLWLMGVWSTGPRCSASALASRELREYFDKIQPGWREADVLGSPYAIADYKVSPALGGEAALKVFRERLNRHGMKLLLDFVPNHVGLDHPWLVEHPEYLMQTAAGAENSFRQETRMGTRWLAYGKDPKWPPWTDTVQIDYRVPVARAAMFEVLRLVSRQCDGVRCDMVMLLLNDVFTKTWAHVPPRGEPPTTEFWTDAIPAVKREFPGFLFLGEVFWGLEARMQSLGFDYTYEKEFFDHVVGRKSAELQKLLLNGGPEYLARNARFLENHDEKRVAETLGPEEQRAAAMLLLGLPGLRLIYDGQPEGRRLMTPVQLARWADEPVNGEIQRLYAQLFAALKESAIGRGEWRMLRPEGWPDNLSAEKFVIIQWQNAAREFDLVVVNLAASPGQCRAHLTIRDLSLHDWLLRDRVGTETFERHGGDLLGAGLHLELPAHGARWFHFSAKPAPAPSGH